MNWKEQYKSFLWLLAFFLFSYYMPIENLNFKNAVIEAFAHAKWYAQEYVLLCLIPAFFISGMIAVFASKNSIIKYFGATAKKWLAYPVTSVSGTIPAICSCTILPLFSCLYKKGAGLSPRNYILVFLTCNKYTCYHSDSKNSWF